MTYQELIHFVGKENYEDLKNRRNYQQSEIPHDLGVKLVDISNILSENKVKLFFKIYEEIPCYAFFSYSKDIYRELSRKGKKDFWELVTSYLNTDNKLLSEPIEYSLWCDFFEDPETAAEAWNKLTEDYGNNLLLEKILKVSGPVPFDLKESVFNTLISYQEWHKYIFLSLLHSTFDVYGKIEEKKGLQVLEQLDIPDETDHREDLIKELQKRSGN